VGGASLWWENRGTPWEARRYGGKIEALRGRRVVMVEKSRHSVGGASRGDYAQDVRYIAREHMEVRRDCSRFALCLRIAARRASHTSPTPPIRVRYFFDQDG